MSLISDMTNNLSMSNTEHLSMKKVNRTKHTPFDATSVSETERYKMIIYDKLSYTDLLIQLAEECNELSAAIIKLVNNNLSNNLIPKTLIEENIIEKMTDVVLCLDLLNGAYTDYNIYITQLKRWVRRLRNEDGEKN